MTGVVFISLLLIALPIVLLPACGEPFQPYYEKMIRSKLVVGGLITDEVSRHTVCVNDSADTHDRGVMENQFVSSAQLRTEDGKFSFSQQMYSRFGIHLTQPLYTDRQGKESKSLAALINEWRGHRKILVQPDHLGEEIRLN